MPFNNLQTCNTIKAENPSFHLNCYHIICKKHMTGILFSNMIKFLHTTSKYFILEFIKYVVWLPFRWTNLTE
jgi:hypothetical protein